MAEKKPHRGTRRDARSVQTRKDKFLKHFSQCGSITEAAKHVPIERKLHYYWLRHDKQYAKDFQEANEIITDTLEAEAIRRATFGVEKPVGFHEVKTVVIKEDGTKEVITTYQPWGTTTEYSDRLLELLLKARKPEQYKERMHHSMDNIPGVPVDLSGLTKRKEDEE